MFEAISYNKFSNKIDLWEICEETKRSIHKEFTPDIEYYVEDKYKKSDITDIYGTPVIRKVAKSREEITNNRNAGIKMMESDLPMEIKVLQKIYAGKQFKVDMNLLNVCFLDIEVEFDEVNGYSEAKDANNKIILITMYFTKSKRLVTLGLKEYTGKAEHVGEYHWIQDEKTLIEKAIYIFKKERSKIISGWNSTGYDVTYILRRSENLGIETNFSPLNKYYLKTVTENEKEHLEPKIDGVSLLDYQELYKKFIFSNPGSFTLQNICSIELNEGKTNLDGLINDLDKRNWNLFVEYNCNDVLLVVKLEQKLKFLELCIILAHEALIPYQDVFSQMRLLTGVILNFLHKQNMVLPDRVHQHDEKLPGGYVYADLGHFKEVINFDVRSFYPHIIMTFNIGNDTIVVDPKKEEIPNLISTPLSEYKNWELDTGDTLYCGGIYYRKDKVSVLSKITSKIFNERLDFKNKQEEAIKNGNKELEDFYDKHQLIRKILINSLFGVLGNKYFHLYDINCARTITLAAQTLLKYLFDNTNDYLKNYFYQNEKYFKVIDEKNKLKNDVIIRADTDSLFLCLHEILEKLEIKFENDDEFINWVNEFVDNVMNPFYTDILQIYADSYGVKQIIEFKREKILTNILILAKKSYSYRLVMKDNKRINGKIYHMGELVKKTIPMFCRNKIAEVVENIFKDSDKETIIKQIIQIKKKFKESNLNDISPIKGTSNYTKYAKDISYYLKNNLSYSFKMPGHVKAALNYNYMNAKYNLKLMSITNGAKIRYIQIKPNNKLNQEVIAWIGDWPKEFDQFFQIDYDTQFDKMFISATQMIFDVLHWGEINLKVSKLKDFFKKN